ncbi:hypothetical protein [Paralysiella testudinis]|uniref:Uncharacterized protein n=1 Tax=Paralysiella testudinis TaxID=2809020 RepID=A0A892ZEH8_9NEIS|nr:hypothetical protein [Paralysiella testudinis]QRQ81053.1 hypothetical protein JQU52_09965 [Paralysiella testudinis]
MNFWGVAVLPTPVSALKIGYKKNCEQALRETGQIIALFVGMQQGKVGLDCAALQL